MSWVTQRIRPHVCTVIVVLCAGLGTFGGLGWATGAAVAGPADTFARLTAARRRIAELEAALVQERRRRLQLERSLAAASQRIRQLSMEAVRFRELAGGKPLPSEVGPDGVASRSRRPLDAIDRAERRPLAIPTRTASVGTARRVPRTSIRRRRSRLARARHRLSHRADERAHYSSNEQRRRMINGYPPQLYRALRKAHFFQADGR